METKSSKTLFAGASRVKRYEEQEPVFAAVAPGARNKRPESLADEAPVEAPETVEVVQEAPVEVVQEAPGAELTLVGLESTALLERDGAAQAPLATTGWRAGVRTATFGLIKPKASAREVKRLEDLRVIRQATWTRAVNVLVANERGGVGKTSATLLLAGMLGSYRGGYVAAFEATQARGNLLELCEGNPARGLAELLEHADQVHTAGAVGGYTAPQTSHADVIATIANRDQIGGFDVHKVRSVLDLFYRITVTDSGHNPHGGSWLAAVDTADALVVPVMPRRLAVHGAVRTLNAVSARGEAGRRLREHATALITHDGGQEDEELGKKLPEELAKLGFRHVVQIPYDPHIRSEGELSIGSLEEASIDAWTHAAACVVDTLLDAPAESPVQN